MGWRTYAKTARLVLGKPYTTGMSVEAFAEMIGKPVDYVIGQTFDEGDDDRCMDAYTMSRFVPCWRGPILTTDPTLQIDFSWGCGMADEYEYVIGQPLGLLRDSDVRAIPDWEQLLAVARAISALVGEDVGPSDIRLVVTHDDCPCCT